MNLRQSSSARGLWGAYSLGVTARLQLGPRPLPHPADGRARLALAIVRDGRAVHLQGFGRADNGGRAFTPQTPFFIGSNTKSFTALAVMQLAEAGLVELDAPVQRYLPWFRVASLQASGQITIRPAEPGQRAGRGARPPGAAFEYSNLNYTTLGLVVETAAGEPFGRYLQAHIFGPLQMRHTYTSAHDARRDGLACGYRYWFGFPAAFDAPALGTVPDGGSSPPPRT